jgi:hypothetical protein
MSAKANRVFKFCAWWTLLASVVIGILLFFPAAVNNVGTQSLPGLLVSVSFGIVGMVGSITSLLLLVGMFVHLLKVSGLSPSSKAIWGTVLILILPIGEIIYFFSVYVRNRAVLKQAV